MAFDFIDIKTYLQNKSENIFLKGFWYSIIVSVLLIIIIFISSIMKKDLYYKDVLIIDDYSVYLIVNYTELDLINNNNKIIINEKTYSYYVDNVNLISDNLHYQIKILINEPFYKFRYGSYEYKIFLQEESLLSSFVRVMKGE